MISSDSVAVSCCAILLFGCIQRIDPNRGFVAITRSEADANGRVCHRVELPIQVEMPAEVVSVKTTCNCLKIDVHGIHANSAGVVVAIIDVKFEGLLPMGDRQQAFLTIRSGSVVLRETVTVHYPAKDGVRLLLPSVSRIAVDESVDLEFFDSDSVKNDPRKPSLISDLSSLIAQGVHGQELDQSGKGCRLRIRCTKVGSFVLNFRLSNGDVSAVMVRVVPGAGKTTPSAFVSMPGQDLTLRSSLDVDSATCTNSAVELNIEGRSVRVSIGDSCKVGRGVLVLNMAKQEVAVPFYIVPHHQ